MMSKTTINGATFKTDAGRVYWCDAWERIDEFVKSGHLTRRHYGASTFGHVDYFIAGQEVSQ